MCIVDTPGLGSLFSGNGATTQAFIPHIDAALVVVGRLKCSPILYGSEFALLQFTHGAGTAALGSCLPAEWCFSMVSMVAINLEIWFDGVQTGESVEFEEHQ